MAKAVISEALGQALTSIFNPLLLRPQKTRGIYDSCTQRIARIRKAKII
jgi:hypothetical protein